MFGHVVAGVVVGVACAAAASATLRERLRLLLFQLRLRLRLRMWPNLLREITATTIATTTNLIHAICEKNGSKPSNV